MPKNRFVLRVWAVVFFVVLVFGYLVYRNAANHSITRIETSAGAITLGESFDALLPRLNTGERVSFGFTRPNTTEEVRRFGSERYRLVYERADGPFCLRSIERLP